MVEMKEFKQVAFQIITDLVKQGKLAPTDMTKPVIETACGVRMWHSLRLVSDAAIFDHLIKKPAILAKGLPIFQVQSAQ